MSTIFTIASIITIFALLPAVIILQIRVLDLMPEIMYIFIIMDILIAGFIALEIFQLVKKLKSDKKILQKEDEKSTLKEEKIEKEWNREKQKKDRKEDEN